MCRDAGRGATTAACVSALGALQDWDVRDRLSELEMPVLVICGDRDRSTAPRHSFELYESITGAELCVVPGTAHNVHLERPDLFASVVLDFLTRT